MKANVTIQVQIDTDNYSQIAYTPDAEGVQAIVEDILQGEVSRLAGEAHDGLVETPTIVVSPV